VFSTHFYSGLGFGVNMNVVGMDVRFPMALVSPLSNIHNVSYDQNTTQGSTRSCNLPKFKKINLSTLLCTEFDLGLFIKNVDMNVIFILCFSLAHFRLIQLDL